LRTRAREGRNLGQMYWCGVVSHVDWQRDFLWRKDRKGGIFARGNIQSCQKITRRKGEAFPDSRSNIIEISVGEGTHQKLIF